LEAARGSAEIPETKRQQECRSAGLNNFATELQSHFASLDAPLMASTAAQFADKRPRATVSIF
jgi:hypothetical protein